MSKNIQFIEGTKATVPAGATWVTEPELADLEKVFHNHIAEKKPAATDPTAKQPCHIIACVVTNEGVTCWYHCV
jgi:hypothetical protein